MDAIEAIITRRSIRKFMDIEIEKNKMGVIFEAGSHAPSSGNIQNWKFFYVRQQDIKQKIADACLQQGWIAAAPVIVVVVAEPHRAQSFYGIRGERFYSIQNCAAVAQNMLLAAHSQGLASCWVGAFEEEALRRALNLGPKFRPQVVLPIGYADETVPEPMKQRIEQLVFLEDRCGGAGRIEDIEWLIKDYNILGRAINKAEKAGKKISKTGFKIFKKIKEKLKKSRKNNEPKDDNSNE